MSVFFPLLDLTTSNAVDEFETERQAIAALRSAHEVHGAESLLDLALLRFEDGHPTLVTMERDLVDRVVEVATR